MGPGIFTFLCFSLFRNVSKHIESVDLKFFETFQFVSVSLLFQLFQCFETPDMGPEIFTFYVSVFRNISKHLETIESVDLEIFSPFQFVSVVLLYNLYVSMFRNTRNGA